MGIVDFIRRGVGEMVVARPAGAADADRLGAAGGGGGAWLAGDGGTCCDTKMISLPHAHRFSRFGLRNVLYVLFVACVDNGICTRCCSLHPMSRAWGRHRVLGDRNGTVLPVERHRVPRRAGEGAAGILLPEAWLIHRQD